MKLNLYTGKPVFSVAPDWKRLRLVLLWVAPTQAPNVEWVRVIAIGAMWPPVRWETCFTEAGSY